MNKTNNFIQKIMFIAICQNLYVQSNIQMNTNITTHEKSLEQKIHIQKLNNQRIQKKHLYYQKLFKRTQKFKNLILTLGIGSSTIIAAYLLYKSFIKKETQNTKNPAKTTKENENINQLFEAWLYKKGIKAKLSDKGFWEIFKFSLKKAVSKNLNFITVSAITTPLLYFERDVIRLCKQKFIQNWKGYDKPLFFKYIQSLEVNFNQIDLFLKNKFHEKEEIKEYYNFFIYNMEDFLAFIDELLNQKMNNSNSYHIIIKLKNLLYKNVNLFSEKLEAELNKNLNFNSTEQLTTLFKKINEQSIRFITFLNTSIYEKI